MSTTAYSTNSQLVEIPAAEWTNLRQLYTREWPRYIAGYYVLDTFIRWTTVGEVDHLRVYSLDGDWSDGTFVCMHRYEIFPNTLSVCTDRLEAILRRLDWTIGLKIGAIRSELRPMVMHVLDSERILIETFHLTLLYHMSQKRAAALDEPRCPEHIELRALSREHAEQINAVWPVRHPASLPLVRQFIALNPCVGAFDRGTGQLVAWCVRYQPGPLGILQVDEEHRRQGLGAIVCRAITRKLALELGADSFAYITEPNTASRRLFEGLGYAHTADAYWIQTRASEGFVWRD